MPSKAQLFVVDIRRQLQVKPDQKIDTRKKNNNIKGAVAMAMDGDQITSMLQDADKISRKFKRL